MARYDGKRGITVKVSSELFQQLEEKRFRTRTTFQEVGEKLFTGWLQADGGKILKEAGSGEGTGGTSADIALQDLLGQYVSIEQITVKALTLAGGSEDLARSFARMVRDLGRLVEVSLAETKGRSLDARPRDAEDPFGELEDVRAEHKPGRHGSGAA